MEDNQIIDLFWKRSESAIKETRKKYHLLLFKIAKNILSNKEDAEECENDTYLGIWNAIPKARPDHFAAFICKITRNISLSRLDYKTAAKRNANVTCALEELDVMFSLEGDTVEKQAELMELTEAVNGFLETRKMENRNIFIRRYFFCDSISEIAQIVNSSDSKVKSILFRERAALKIYLQDRGMLS